MPPFGELPSSQRGVTAEMADAKEFSVSSPLEGPIPSGCRCQKCLPPPPAPCTDCKCSKCKCNIR